MDLLNQFQGFIGSIGFGFSFYMVFHPYLKIINRTTIFIKICAIPLFFLIGTYLYFKFLVKYTYGILNIFYPLSIFIGVMFYHLFYYENFEGLYISLIEKISSSIKLKIHKFFDIINKKFKRRKRKDVKCSKSKKQNT